MTRNTTGVGTRPHKWHGRRRGGLTVGTLPDSRPDRRSVYGKTQAKCQTKLDDLRRQRSLGLTAIRHKTLTLTAHLDGWLEQKALEVKLSTIATYRAEFAHVKSILGRLKLTSNTPADVQRMMREIVGKQVTYVYHRTTVGKESRRNITLTARAANQAKSILGNALDDAMTLGLIPSNPTQPVRSLRHDPLEITAWTAEEVQRFTETTLVKAAAYHALYYLALTAGLRAGELIALQWSNPTDNHLRIARTANTDGQVTIPESAASNRVLALATDPLETLGWHRHALRQDGLVSPLVFPTSAGTMVGHSHLLRSLHAWSETAKRHPRTRPAAHLCQHGDLRGRERHRVGQAPRALGREFHLEALRALLRADDASRDPDPRPTHGLREPRGVQIWGTGTGGGPN